MDVENFQYLFSLIRNNDICPKLSPGLPCAEQHYKTEQDAIIKFSICLRTKYNMLLLQRTFYYANRFTIRKVNYKYLECFETWGWRKM
jgi:hypothetical protein